MHALGFARRLGQRLLERGQRAAQRVLLVHDREHAGFHFGALAFDAGDLVLDRLELLLRRHQIELGAELLLARREDIELALERAALLVEFGHPGARGVHAAALGGDPLVLDAAQLGKFHELRVVARGLLVDLVEDPVQRQVVGHGARFGKKMVGEEGLEPPTLWS